MLPDLVSIKVKKHSYVKAMARLGLQVTYDFNCNLFSFRRNVKYTNLFLKVNVHF